MVLKILFSVFVVGLAVIANPALFDVISPKVFFGCLFFGLCSLIVSIVWS